MPDPALKKININSLKDLQIIQKEQKWLHPLLYCTLILGTSVQLFIYLPLLGFCFFFSLSSSFDFHFLLNMLWNWRQWLFSHSKNTIWWIEMLRVFPPRSSRHHVTLVLRLFFSLRKWISNLLMKSFSPFFWHGWYAALTKVSFKLDSRSWEAGELWNVNKCQGVR